MDVLARVVADIRAHRPDHIAMTGDILNIGLPSEFPLASAWLDTLGARRDVSFVPGNHDAYVRGSMPYVARTFAPWTGDHVSSRSEYPYLRRRGDIALIGLSSAIPTAPLIASGQLGLGQRRDFARLLDEAQAQGLARVVMIHHPPYRGGATPGRGLRDAAAFESIIERHGAELVIHGHNHRRMAAWLLSPGGSTPVVGVASASAVPGSFNHRAAWNLYSLEKGDKGWRIELCVRGLMREGEEIVEIHRERLA
jgi:3',5'-cyclic AMP phosphodiesterase CpdA